MASEVGDLPNDVHVGAMLKGRIKELSGLSYVISKDVKHGKLASQQVPRHMRRRAVSHDVRRLPQRLRNKYAWEKQQSGGDVPAAKRPSRKHRRRASNLLKEYNRRQMKNFWLETHIWHAKRFHMTERWGYKIPDYPNDKCWRACYRATKSKAIMFDVSYLNPIQIKGDKSLILNSLNRLTCVEMGQMVHSTPSDGEKTLLLSDLHGRVIGDITHFWVDSDCNTEEEADERNKDLCTLWMFCHPAYVKTVLHHIKLVLDIKDDTIDRDIEISAEKNTDGIDVSEAIRADVEMAESLAENIAVDANKDDDLEPAAKKLKIDSDSGENRLNPASLTLTEKPSSDTANTKPCTTQPSRIKPVKNVNLEKLEPRNVPANRAPTFTSPDQLATVVDFQGTINRFKLVGPNSAAILRSVCVPASVLPPHAASESTSSETNRQLTWWKQFYAQEEKQKHHQRQSIVLANLSSKCRQQNVAVTVRDPRLLLPLKKNQEPTSTTDTNEAEAEKVISLKTADGEDVNTTDWTKGAFFSSDIRDAVTLSKSSDAEINKRRSEQLVPGSKLNLGDEESRIPVIILCEEEGFSLLVPAGWAVSFWICLVYYGCRVAGDKQLQHLYIEQGRFPTLSQHPDSAAGEFEATRIGDQLRQLHFLQPPNKRVNHAKLGIISPFQAPWKVLLEDWSSDHPPMAFIKRTGLTTPKTTPPVEAVASVKVMRDAAALAQLRAGTFTDWERFRDCLVGVRLAIKGKGRLGFFTLICLPTEEDLEEEVGSWEGPVEVIQKDCLEREREQTKEQHQKTKKRLKRSWKKLKNKQVQMKAQSTALGTPLDTDKLDKVTTSITAVKQLRNQENERFAARSEQLWLGGDFDTVRHANNRQLMGYTTHGNMSYRVGGYVGLGFVALRSLKLWRELSRKRHKATGNEALDNQKIECPVLTRETTSLQYRFATLTIL